MFYLDLENNEGYQTASPSLFYGPESLISGKENFRWMKFSGMRFIRLVKDRIRPECIQSTVIRQELGVQTITNTISWYK